MAADADGFALAILLVGDRYALQHRDDSPAIDAPGCWGLFGGRIEPGETPAEAVVREIREELCITITPARLRFLWSVVDRQTPVMTGRRFWFFEADVTDLWDCHRLTEGQAAECFRFDQIDPLPIPGLIRGALARHHTTQVVGAAVAPGTPVTTILPEAGR